MSAEFLPAVGTALNDCSWEDISKIAAAGLASTYWSVGATKTITINGTVGTLSLSNLSVDVFILGFDHNSSVEGINRIHFQIGKISSKLIGLIDSGYNNYYTNGAKYFNMKGVTKYADAVGNSSNVAANVKAFTDYLFLLAEFEVQGIRYYANQYEQNYQKQYAYYSSGNSRVMYRHNATGSTAWWWLRSAGYNYSGIFCRVSTDGSANLDNAGYAAALAPGFAV